MKSKFTVFIGTFFLTIALGAVAQVNIFDMSDTWDDAGTTFTSIKMDVTDTNSQADSKLIDLQVGSASMFSVIKSGQITTDLYTFPAADGTVNQVLETDGAGALGWVDAAESAPFTLTYTATYNYGMGFGALDSVTASSGLNNIGIGTSAGTNITTSDNNILIGLNAGFAYVANVNLNVIIGNDLDKS